MNQSFKEQALLGAVHKLCNNWWRRVVRKNLTSTWVEEVFDFLLKYVTRAEGEAKIPENFLTNFCTSSCIQSPPTQCSFNQSQFIFKSFTGSDCLINSSIILLFVDVDLFYIFSVHLYTFELHFDKLQPTFCCHLIMCFYLLPLTWVLLASNFLRNFWQIGVASLFNCSHSLLPLSYPERHVTFAKRSVLSLQVYQYWRKSV